MLEFVNKEGNSIVATTTSFDHNHNRGDVVYVIVEQEGKKEVVSEPLTVFSLHYYEISDLNKYVTYTLKDMEGEPVDCLYADANIFTSHEEASEFLSSEAVEPF